MSYSVSNSVESTTSQNNADFGISMQAMLCDRAGIAVNHTAAEHFRANYNESYEDELLTICEKIESIIPSKLKKYLTELLVHTPKKNKVGVDSFVFTATDPAGNVSREATVTIRIMKPTDKNQYTDTVGSSCRFAAEWMKNTGIFVGESFNGNGCFRPDKQVSRGDFLTMLVGTLELEPQWDAVSTGFTDECADWLKPYLAAAMRSGLTAGWPEGDVFGAEEPITGAEAAVMLQNALDLTAQTQEVFAENAPEWAEEAVAVLGSYGVELDGEAVLTRGEAAELMYQIHGLKQDAPGMRAIRTAQ